MIKGKLKNNYKTNYHLELVDSRTGEVKEKADTSNIFLRPWWNGARNQYCSHRMIRRIYFGSGTGTVSEGDGGCFKHLWTIDTSSETETIDTQNKSIKYVATASVPASSSYVGNITEICCESVAAAPDNGQWSVGVFTHALLKDAEGNPLAISKTDVDILKVTVTIEVAYVASSPWTLIKYPGYLHRKRVNQVMGWGFVFSHWAMVSMCLGTTSADPMNIKYHSWSNSGAYGLQAAEPTCVIGATGSMNSSTKKMTFSNVRIDTAVGASRPYYFNYVIFTGLCYTPFPNAELFPNYDIEDINIGLGDGTNTLFANPMNYFVKDTDKVYKDDVLLVRGVDYNIDYRNNHNRLPELAATRNCTFLSGVQLGAGNNGGHKQRLFQRFVKDMSAYLMDATYVGWTASTPLMIKLDDFAQEATVTDEANEGPVNPWRDVNTFYCPSWVVTGTITVSYSEDAEEWTQACVVEHVSGTANTKTFAVVNAPYWRIEGTNTNWTTHNFTSDDVNQEVFLGYVGNSYVVFTEAPGEGAVLRMDVSMDRPFKNGNFVIDYSGELQMS